MYINTYTFSWVIKSVISSDAWHNQLQDRLQGNLSQKDGMGDLSVKEVTHNPLILEQPLRSPLWLTPPAFLLCSHLEVSTGRQLWVSWEGGTGHPTNTGS